MGKIPSPFECSDGDAICPCKKEAAAEARIEVKSATSARPRCYFNGTILYIRGSKFRVTKSIEIKKETRVPITLRNLRYPDKIVSIIYIVLYPH